MDTAGDNVQHRDVGSDVHRRRPRRATAHLLVTALGLVLLPLASAPALAATSTLPGAGVPTPPSPTQPPTYSNPVPAPAPGPGDATSPSPTPTSPPPSGGAAVAPTIVDPGDITTLLARFSGRASPGHQVRVADPAVPSASVCRATTDGSGAWSCVGTVHSGPAQVFTVLDTTTSALPSADAAPTDVIVPPTIDARRPSTGTVTGTGHPGATVTVSRSGSAAVATAVVGSGGTWAARWGTGPGAPADGTVSVSATQTASTATGYRSDLRSAASAARTLVVDRTAPAAPRITAPVGSTALGAQPVRIAGTAEPGTLVTAYIDSTAVCRSSVAADGSWSCRAADALRPGSHRVRAVDQDEAGNTSSPAAAVAFRVTVSGTASTPGVAPTAGGGTGTGAPGGDHTGTGHGSAGSGSNGTNGTGTDGTGPDRTSSGGADGSGAGGPGTGTAGGALPGGGTGGPDWSGPAGDWTVATAYDHAVPTIQTTFSWRTLAVAVGVAATFLLLVAGPVRVLAGALRRGPVRASRFTGRNRTRSERRRGDDAVAGWVTVTLGIAVAGLLALLGTGIALEARYVRLAFGVVAGVTVLSIGVVLATRWAAGDDRHTVTYRLSPGLLLAAVLASGLTRAADLSPALVIGVLLVPVGRTDADTAAMHLGRGVAACARSATWRSVTLLVLAAAGWVLHSVAPAAGFTGSLVSEFASTLCVGGLGSLVVTLLPLRGSAGAALAAVSRPRYAALAAVGVGFAAAVYSGPAGTHVPTAAMITGVGVLLVVAAAAWAWRRSDGAALPS